jgi:hypothetical protein
MGLDRPYRVWMNDKCRKIVPSPGHCHPDEPKVGFVSLETSPLTKCICLSALKQNRLGKARICAHGRG